MAQVNYPYKCVEWHLSDYLPHIGLLLGLSSLLCTDFQGLQNFSLCLNQFPSARVVKFPGCVPSCTPAVLPLLLCRHQCFLAKFDTSWTEVSQVTTLYRSNHHPSTTTTTHHPAPLADNIKMYRDFGNTVNSGEFLCSASGWCYQLFP